MMTLDPKAPPWAGSGAADPPSPLGAARHTRGVPELPEVEAARLVIERSALGRRITEVDDADEYVCRPHPAGEIRAALLGRHLTTAHRRGKTMWCETVSRPAPRAGARPAPRDERADRGRRRVRGGGPRGGKPEWYRFTLRFADGGSLRLLDKRRLGRVALDPDLDGLGPDAAEISRQEFRERVGRGTAPLKARLLDQSVLAGVGNLLADEVLWQARLDPQRPAGGLDDDELDDLQTPPAPVDPHRGPAWWRAHRRGGPAPARAAGTAPAAAPR